MTEWENLIQLDARTYQWYLNGRRADEIRIYIVLLHRARETGVPDPEKWASNVIENAFLEKRK